MSIATEVAVRDLQEKVARLERELGLLKQVVDHSLLASVPRGTSDDKLNGRSQKR